MFVVELLRPGSRLQGLADVDARDAEALLTLIQSCIVDAALSLSLFNEAQVSASAAAARRNPAQDWRDDAVLRTQLQVDLLRNLPTDLPEEARWQAESEVGARVEVELKRRKWSAGKMPFEYEHRLPFLYAKSFLYALDSIAKSLEQLTLLSGVPSQVATELSNFRTSFPRVKDVRDSAHHVEDRIQGKVRDRRLALQPVHGVIEAPNGALVIDHLNGDKYGGTLADGSYGEVEVSDASLIKVGQLVQRVLDAFTWTGSAEHLPH